MTEEEVMKLMILNGQQAELMKAARIDARIQSLSEEVEM